VKSRSLIIPILFLFFSVQVFGQGVARDRIVDNAGILSESQKNELASLIDTIAAAYNFDLVIVTETSIGDKSPMNYADDFFDYNGYGLGEDRDGCIFLRVMGSRDYWFSTSGRGRTILNPYAFSRLESDTGKYLGQDNYYAAFLAFIFAWDEFLGLDAQGGRSYNFFYKNNLILVLISWLIAFAIGLIVVSVWKNGMNTAMPKTQAAAYIIPGSLNFTAKNDSFLYSTVTKTKREAQSASSSGRVATHTSSSGRSHGGGGGKK
jgi:uncharacterized protein